MAEIILSQAGAAIGSNLLPGGIGLFGKTLSGAALGGVIGGLAGRVIDSSLAAPVEGARIKSLYVTESREGAGLPLVYGRMRVGGQVIWASRFKEYRSEQSAGKGGPTYTEYTYSVSIAVALCQGPITRVDRIWANGEVLPLHEYNWRLYRGDERQLPDPLIEAIEGAGEAPAYRGTAYIVFEDLPLDAFGNRLPQLSFEVVRAGQAGTDSLNASVTGVNIIPASGEFVYATSIVRERGYPAIERAINANNANGEADLSVSLRQFQSDLPRVDHAALTVAWFGDDVSAGRCRIRPGVEQRVRNTVPYAWSVDGISRRDAYLISRNSGSPNYGGTPADQCVIEGIQALKAAGIGVTLSPFLMMDVPPGNGLTDPYGGSEQAPFPWRGRITVSNDKTQSVRQEVEAFVGADGGFGFRHFILHHARLAKRAGGVDAFLIGSEMARLTKVRDQRGRFPFVEALVEIAAEVKSILGPQTRVSYAADWTEYGSYAPGDGTGDVLFPMDQLWASDAVDFVGVDWYPPASDWRDGDDHADYEAALGNLENEDYLRSQLIGGEAFDWYYASGEARAAQTRSPIKDTAHGEDWIFRQKDLRGWWANAHYERPGGRRASQRTAWVPGSKPIRMIEIGFPAVDKGTNSPNLFYDPKSIESAVPPFSNGARDDLLQRRALSVATRFWGEQSMIEQVLVWAWDGRPWPDFPARGDVWSDGDNWQFGHWLNGRTGLIDLSEVVEDMALKSGTEIEARRLSGIIDGFAIDGVTSLASALSPLTTAYEFDISETANGLTAQHEGVVTSAVLVEAHTLEDSVQRTRILLDKQPSAVSLNYISGDGGYQQAVVEARAPGANSGVTLSYRMPLVMSETRAKALADRMLDQDMKLESLDLALPPGEAPGMEISDRVQYLSNDWIVARIEEQGLERQLKLRQPRLAFERIQSFDVPSAEAPSIVQAEPFGKLIDTPALDHLDLTPPYVAVTANPWRGAMPIKVGPDALEMTERGFALVPAGIGRLETALAATESEGWDEMSVMDLFMPGETLSSRSEAAILSGQNRLLIEHEAGWELLAWRDAELVGSDLWQLRGLRRGLLGTDIRDVSAGACVILADSRLAAIRMTRADLGQAQFWRAGTGALQPFTYRDLAGRFD
ncbi:MAG: glycoside hydrolase/phage tail family protein [Pseudomonadota bacterium]